MNKGSLEAGHVPAPIIAVLALIALVASTAAKKQWRASWGAFPGAVRI